MNKKLILFLMLGLILVGAGIFVYLNYFRLTPVEKWDSAKSSPREDYVVTEKDGRMFVNNKKAGISFVIPEGWGISEDEFINGLLFSSPDASTEKTYLPNTGCQIGLTSNSIKTDIDIIKKTATDDFKLYPMTVENIEDFNILENKSVKYYIKDNIYDLKYIWTFIPYEKNTYEIVLYSALKDIEKCESQFNQFLETISFN